MVKICTMIEIPIEELVVGSDYDLKDIPLYVKFKDSHNLRHMTISSKMAVSVFKDTFYVFDKDNNLKIRKPIDEIEFVAGITKPNECALFKNKK